MSVIRIKHENNYVCIHKGALEDPNLSFKAKGLWAYCMSRPDDWSFHVSHLATVCQDRKTAIYSAIKELIKAGYCEKIQLREKGRNCGVEYIIHEISNLKKSLRHSGNLNSESLNSENQPLLSNDSLLSNDAHQKPPNPQRGDAPKGAECEVLAFGEFVTIGKQAHQKLCEDHGFETISSIIDEINDYLASTGKKPYRDYAATIRQWLRRRKQQAPKTQTQTSQAPKLTAGQEANFNENKALVDELKVEHPDVAAGLNWFYKYHVLKDKNDPGFDISGLISHADFCRTLGKHLGLKIYEAKFLHGQKG
jgi:hypothetical protein